MSASLKNSFTNLLITILVLAAMTACNSAQAVSSPAIEEEPDSDPNASTPAGMANPASEYCLEVGGTIAIRQDESGEYGVCQFSDGSECEEWDLFRGACQAEQPLPTERSGGAVDNSPSPTRGQILPVKGSAQAETPTPLPSITPTIPTDPLLPAELQTINVQNASSLGQVARLTVPNVYWTVFSPDNGLLAAVRQRPEDRTWTTEVWGLQYGLPVATVEGGPAVSFSLDTSQIATQIIGDGFRLWQVADGSDSGSWDFPGAIAITQDWTKLAVNHGFDGAADPEAITLVNLDSGDKIATVDPGGMAVAATFSPDGRLMAVTTGGITSKTTIWETSTGALLAEFEGLDRLTFSPDGRLAAALSGPNREIKLWETESFRNIVILDNADGPQPLELAFSTGGDVIAAALGNAIRLWDTASGDQLSTIPTQASDVSFSTGSMLLASSNFQGDIILWAVQP